MRLMQRQSPEEEYHLEILSVEVDNGTVVKVKYAYIYKLQKPF